MSEENIIKHPLLYKIFMSPWILLEKIIGVCPFAELVDSRETETESASHR